MLKYDLLPSQTEYFQGSILGDSGIYTQTVVMICDGDISLKKLTDAVRNFEKQNDVFRLKFTRDMKQSFADYQETADGKSFDFLEFESKSKILEFAKDDVNSRKLDIFEKTYHVTLVKCPGASGMVLTGHHIICDGFSIPLMAEQLTDIMGLRAGNQDSIAVGSYENHIKSELEYPKSIRFQKDMKYWEGIFNCDNPPEMSLFEAGGSTESLEKRIAIDQITASKIKDYAEDRGISMASFFNAVAGIALGRLAGKDHFTMGAPVLNRTTKEDYTTIGLYLHVVPMEIRLLDVAFDEFMEMCDDTTMNLFRHQKFTQHEIKKYVTGEQNLFDVVVDYQNYYNGAKLSYDFYYSNFLPVNMEIHFVQKTDGHIEALLRYRKGLLNDLTIDVLLNSIINIIKGALTGDREPVTVMKIAEPYYEEGKTVAIPDKSVYEYFEETCLELYQNKALEFYDGRTYNFGELKAMAQQIDSFIRQRDEGFGIIAIMADRSPEMFASIYGIIRGGRPYMPLSPEWPLKRIETVLKEAKSNVIIYEGNHRDKAARLKESIGDSLVLINASEIIYDNSAGAIYPFVKAAKTDPLYVIFTSGSTGNPKGAVISNESFVNRLLWMDHAYPLETGDVVLNKTPYTFDVSVWEVFWWAFKGGCLRVMEPGKHFLPQSITDEIQKGGVTHVHFVPSVFKVWLNYLKSHEESSAKLKTLKHIILSGEALKYELTNEFYRITKRTDIGIHNLYGPTECAIDVTYFDVRGMDRGNVPIGKPIWNTRIYINDLWGNHLPKGQSGEIAIGGIGVGLGYINNRELTDKVFVSKSQDSGRIYLTGDMGYYDEEGNIVYMGRKDSQIKLNGQRIELGEIEKASMDTGVLDECAAIINEEGSRDILCLYIVSQNPECANIVREHLSDVLPTYMLPSRIIPIDSMPITMSGKTDKMKLALYPGQGALNEAPAAETQEEPFGELEKAIASDFCDILKIDKAYRDTDFLAYRSSSLDIVSLLAGSDMYDGITGANFIRNSTPRKLACLIRSKMTDRTLGKTEDITCLYNGSEEGTAYVLFPYAGGGAEAFTDLMRELKLRDSGAGIYYVSFDDVRDLGRLAKVSNALIEMSDRRKIVFYSHCAGLAIAFNVIYQIKDILRNSNDTRTVKDVIYAYIGAASIPFPNRDGKCIWRKMPDCIPLTLLRLSGSPKEVLENGLLERFKDDADVFFKFHMKDHIRDIGKYDIPTTAVYYKKDLFTMGHKGARTKWEVYATDMRDIVYVDADTHYFQAKNADVIADIIFQRSK